MRTQNNIYFEQQNGAEITVGHDKLTYCSGLRRATMVVVEGLCIKNCIIQSTIQWFSIRGFIYNIKRRKHLVSFVKQTNRKIIIIIFLDICREAINKLSMFGTLWYIIRMMISSKAYILTNCNTAAATIAPKICSSFIGAINLWHNLSSKNGNKIFCVCAPQEWLCCNKKYIFI